MNVMSSYHVAVRQPGGVCKGTLWRQLESRSVPYSSIASSNNNTNSMMMMMNEKQTCDYCVLVGVRLQCFESLAAYQKGDTPVCSLKVVGASDSPVAVGGLLEKEHSKITSFRLVTNQGTHVSCQAPTSHCRDLWLATLHAGLERALQEPPQQQLAKLSPPQPQKTLKRTLRAAKKCCLSCGAPEGAGGSGASTTMTSTPTKTILIVPTAAAPLPQYGKESRCDLCTDCATAQGLLDHLDFVKSCLVSAEQERQALLEARDLCFGKAMTMTTTTEAVSSEAAAADASSEAAAAAEMLAPSPSSQNAEQKQQQEEKGDDHHSSSTSESWSHVGSGDSSSTSTPSPPDGNSPPEEKSPLADPSWHAVPKEQQQQQQQEQQQWIHLPPTQASTKALLEMLQQQDQKNPQAATFAALKRRSPFLDDLSNELLNGRMDVPDFLEQLDNEVVATAMGGGGAGTSNNTNNEDQEASSSSGGGEFGMMTALKKQAFQVAGDMGTAMKLLLDHALPVQMRQRRKKNTGGSSSSNTSHTEMLSCILDFFLDLCDEGELSSVAFFWQQLCHIHLRMLPPENADELARVDLMEDFLLTIASRHSIHLALELIWSHTADLEESLVSSATAAAPCAAPCRRRRFAVLRFVCELESFLFDFDDGWGGGSVSLGKMLQSTGHQVELLKSTMRDIQVLRKRSPHCLARSSRMEILSASKYDKPTEEAVQEKLRIATNADYFSSHLNFTKRICDIAEKLRFMEIQNRARALEEELELLNSSGAMGGDPLNRVREDDLVRVVRVPTTEGHVFRSKERTPVLLLMEVVDESSELEIAEEKARSVTLKSEKCKAAESSESHQADANESFKGDTKEEDPRNQKGQIEEGDKSEEEGAVIEGSEIGTKSSTEQQVALEGASVSIARTVAESQAENHSVLSDEHGEATLTPVKSRQARTPFPSPEVDTLATVNLLEGSTIELKPSSPRRKSPSRPSALKRFDSDKRVPEPPSTPQKDVKDVEQLVNSVMEQQLSDLVVPDLLATCTEEDTGKGRESPKAPGGTVEGGVPLVHAENEAASADMDVVGISETRESSQTVSRELSERRGSKKMTTLGNLAGGSIEGGDTSNTMAPTGDVRREVLNVIMMRGMQGNTIAAGAADSLQQSLKELERRRATELLMTDDEKTAQAEEEGIQTSNADIESTRQKLFSLGIGAATPAADESRAPSTEEDEVMEAIRLLLIQNRVAQGQLSEADAAKVLQHTSLSQVSSGAKRSPRESRSAPLSPSEMPTIDAGDVDRRLVGCGPLPPAILQALTLWKGEMVSNAELLELVKKDIEFLRHSVLFDAENVEKLNEDSAFWGRFAFGERWAEKKARIAASSPQGSIPGWDLLGVIVKSNDDLRQEAFVMQLIELCQEAFELAGLELWVNPYRILATGRKTGVIEMVRNAMSFDALKKRPGYGKGGLREHLLRMTEFTADPGEALKTAQRNFVRSLAAYSLMSYFFLFKDRHNGNILLDTAGHIIHIDFGFVFGVAPGGSFSLEMSTPFKLTEEMLEVMGGLKSPLFSEFVTLFCCGFLALQSYSGTFLTIVEIMCRDSTFKCFDGRDTEEILSKLRERFCPDLNKEQTVAFALDLIKQATTSYGTRQYDVFQYLSQGIAT